MLHHTLALFFLAALSSCAHQDPYNFVPVAPDRIEHLGVSLLPPPGDNWFVAEQRDLNEWRLLFSRKLPDMKTDSGLFIMVVVDALPVEFHQQFATEQTLLEGLRRRLEGPGPAHLTTVAGNSAQITVDGSTAVRHTRTSEESGGAVIVDSESIALAHPKDPTLGVMISLSCRHDAGAPSVPLSQLAAAFLQQLHFGPPIR
jgi:hypothetical protein